MDQDTDGTFSKDIELPNSLGTKIRYIFIVDGHMMPDLHKKTERDGDGTTVNVLRRTLRVRQLPTGTETGNLTAAFREQYRELCRIYNHGDHATAIVRALELYRQVALPIAIRAACCCVLATNDTDYMRFAREAVEIYKGMQAAHPTNAAIQKLLADAESLLKDAEMDEAKTGWCTLMSMTEGD